MVSGGHRIATTSGAILSNTESFGNPGANAWIATATIIPAPDVTVSIMASVLCFDNP